MSFLVNSHRASSSFVAHRRRTLRNGTGSASTMSQKGIVQLVIHLLPHPPDNCVDSRRTPTGPIMGSIILPRATMTLRQAAWKSCSKFPNFALSLSPRLATFDKPSQIKNYTTSRDEASKKPPSNVNSGAHSSQNPSLPKFTFEGFGANRTAKVVLILALSLAATAESIFWVKAGYQWLSSSSKDDDKPEEA